MFRSDFDDISKRNLKLFLKRHDILGIIQQSSNFFCRGEIVNFNLHGPHVVSVSPPFFLFLNIYNPLKMLKQALAGVAQRIECWPANKGYQFDSQSGHMPRL